MADKAVKEAEKKPKQAEKKEDKGKKKEEKPRVLHFVSKDKEYCIYFKSPTNIKEGGYKKRVKGIKAQFLEHHYALKDTPENREMKEMLLNHPQYGISFQIMPDIGSGSVNLDKTIEQYEEMDILELRAECRRKGIVNVGDMSKERMILEIAKLITKKK